MDRAIVIGIYEFIGFHLGQYFLEQGMEVIGIHIPTGDSDQWFEEKRLSVGRNANFREEDESHLLTLSDHSAKSFTFIDYYSFYMKREEERLMKAVEKSSWIEKTHVAFLMPVQLYEDMETFNHHFAFYLPTIYGPWQPSNFLFHQALCHSESSIVLDEREWTEDAIYIDDTIKTIVSHLKSQHKSMLLKSNVKDQWKNIMIMLRNNQSFQQQDEKLSVRENMTVVEVDGIDPKEGITRQKSHMAQISR